MPDFSKLKKTFESWGGSAASFFTYTHLSHDLISGLLPAFLPLIRESLGLSYLQAGFILSALNVTSGISQFPGGWLADKFKRQVVMAVGLTGVGVTAAAVGLSPTYALLLAALIIMGIFAGAYHPSAVSMISSVFNTDRRGKAIAIHMIGGSLGFAIGPILGGAIAEFTGWRFAFVLLSLPSLIAVPLVLRRFRTLPMEKKSKPATGAQASSQDNIYKVLRAIGVIFVLATLTQLIGGSVISFVPVYLVDKHHVAPAAAATLTGIIRTGGIAGSLLGGWLSDRWGRINSIFASFVLTGPVIYLFTILPMSAALIFVFMLFALLLYMRQATVQPYLMDSVPSYLRATIFGIYFGLGMEGVSIIQPIFGHYMDVYGVVRVFDVVALISIGLSVLSLLLVRQGRKAKTPSTGA